MHRSLMAVPSLANTAAEEGLEGLAGPSLSVSRSEGRSVGRAAAESQLAVWLGCSKEAMSADSLSQTAFGQTTRSLHAYKLRHSSASAVADNLQPKPPVHSRSAHQ